MKNKILKNEMFSFTGSKVLETIMDRSTPNIDLLVRESIQNSADAVLEQAKHVQIEFNFGEFYNESFINLINDNSNFSFPFTLNTYNYLSINDKNTTGLLGGHIPTPDGPNNLYNLVYDIMNKGGKTGTSGGSWGIGKSVYYRFGVGFCVYYSRTNENGNYINKLAISFIEDETKSNRVIREKDNRGIAFFGDLDENGAICPIYDEVEIERVLAIFNEKLYSGIETGTKVIIPYFRYDKFDHSVNVENCWWREDFGEALAVAIQRWYFSRINNDKYPGKQLRISINKEPLQLNKFFSVMQLLYNGELSGCDSHDVYSKNPNIKLGKLHIKKFTQKELFMLSPNNFPSPYCFFDLDTIIHEHDLPIIGYMRKPGMVITYDKSFDKVTLLDDEYLIGFFILDDDSSYSGESLSSYIRGTEKANHKSWEDALVDECPQLTLKYPVRKIFTRIKQILIEEYRSKEELDVETSNSKLRKRLGKLLLPPSGFGSGTDAGKDGGGHDRQSVSKKRKSQIYFSGFEGEYLKFTIDSYLQYNDIIEFEFYIKSGSKKYSFFEWVNLGFDIPCELYELRVNNLKIGKEAIKGNGKYLFESLPASRKVIQKSISFLFKKVNDLDYYGLSIQNINENKKDVMFSYVILVKPLDNTYSISIESNVTSVNCGGETGESI